MKIKKYVARDFKTALQRAKEEMGQDAIILHTRQVKKGGILGLLYPPRVEITVVVDDKLQVNSDRLRSGSAPGGPAAAAKPEISASIDTISPTSTINNSENSSREDEVLLEIQRMKNLMTDIKSRMYEVEVIKGMPEQIQQFYETLINNNVDRDIALKVVNSVATRLPKDGISDDAWARDVCLHTLQEVIQQVQPIQIKSERKGMIVFLVGPTGVGKTTTIAKLAANLTFLDSKSVALITLDTYRVSAAEQLRTFAEIIGIPISVVFTPTDLMLAIEQYREKDLIFVDTAGRSPYNSEQMEELREFVDIARPDETILVMSITTDNNDLIYIYQRFQSIGVDKLIFTKLDETCSYGSILNALYEIRKPIAYFTTGQNVPDDIEVPDALRLAQRLLRRDEAL
ncbi:MAG: flagellar biosynthesis protein FlhF [Syntrophomonadaceae bacterium]|nr:flagellar biosynthesis protein FlhF [Syntrophomonadaceae bacterium]